ncbi:hypothetical protein F1728_19360 [Gimesia benthica]|uniref:Uncharacterized protein n=1 Tax=Gimesia benthica TaxID=2608982 RepID=A0A6I6AGM9_9PLAN|nr:hypothetical protein [Gimesia benthica]QGQ24712.1 hypothetical protein F1728_19360 [Gimesia benthica]
MIIEQAFMKLPEILTGSRFPTQGYEGGIVGALSLALLQQLNACNINSPLAALQQERLYRKSDFWKMQAGKERHLRADLHLSLEGFRTASHALSSYGWRHNNWLEAKFFRTTTSAQMQNTAGLLADLIRLMTLVPIECSKDDTTKTNSGRYLLHVYLGQPKDYLSIRNKKKNIERAWLSPMLDYGRWDTNGYIKLADETDGILKFINPRLSDLKVRYVCTNLILEPIFDIELESFYCCILTRLDSFSVKLNQNTWTVKEDRTFSNSDSYKKISDYVGKYINIKEIEKMPVSEAEKSHEIGEIGGGVNLAGEAGISLTKANGEQG